MTSFGRKTKNTLEKQVTTELNGKFLHKLRCKLFSGCRFRQREIKASVSGGTKIVKLCLMPYSNTNVFMKILKNRIFKLSITQLKNLTLNTLGEAWLIDHPT